jgi:hypothetical protein
MNDKELLELAAKAAGIEIELCHFGPSKSFFIVEDGRLKEQWNPLKDDAQALCLAVKLRIDVSFPSYIKPERPVVHAGKYWHRNESCWYPFKEFRDEDPYAATCRAIVRAAAEIGRGME